MRRRTASYSAFSPSHTVHRRWRYVFLSKMCGSQGLPFAESWTHSVNISCNCVCVCLMPFVRQYIPIVSLLSMYTPYPLLQASTALVRRIAGKIIKPRNHSQFRQPFKLPRFSSIPASNDSTLKGSSINVGSFKGAVSNSKHIRLYPTALHDT